MRRVVLLSTLGVVTRPFGTTRVAMRALEDTVRESGLEWAVLRPGGFASNALWWAESVRTRRVVAAPFGDTGVPVVDPADIAAVAAACLLEDRHTGGAYELTGPEVITPRGQTEALAAVLGSSVDFHELTREDAGAGMSRAMPADDTLDILGPPSPAEQRVSPDVERVLGRAPRAFADRAARNVDAFRRVPAPSSRPRSVGRPEIEVAEQHDHRGHAAEHDGGGHPRRPAPGAHVVGVAAEGDRPGRVLLPARGQHAGARGGLLVLRAVRPPEVELALLVVSFGHLRHSPRPPDSNSRLTTQ